MRAMLTTSNGTEQCHGQDHEVALAHCPACGTFPTTPTFDPEVFNVVIIRYGVRPPEAWDPKKLVQVPLPRQLLPYHVSL